MGPRPRQRVAERLRRAEHLVALVCTVSALGALSPGLRHVHAAEALSYRVAASADPVSGQVRGTVDVRARIADGEGALRLWMLADRVAVAPEAMDERTSRFIYPGALDRGEARVVRAWIDGRPVEVRRLPAEAPRRRDVAGADVALSVTPGPAREVDVRVQFALSLPRRFGRLGRASDVLSMTAPWYPLLVGDASPLAQRPRQHLELRVAGDAQAWAAGEPLGAAGIDREAAYVPVVIAPRLFIEQLEVRGVEVSLLSRRRLYRDPPARARGEAALRDWAHVDVVRPIRAAVADALETYRLATGRPPPDRLSLALVPSRTELAADAPGWVLLSDRIFEVTPIEALRAFHRRALVRALFLRLLRRPVAELEPPADRLPSARLRATLLVDLDETRRHGHLRTPQELLGWAGFHPTVDQLLYAPQVAFVDAYFGAIAERDPFREAPERARDPAAGGRRLIERARDLFDESRFQLLSRELLRMRRPLRALLRDVGGDRAIRRYEGWLREPLLPVNYRLVSVRSEHHGSGYRHRVRVAREGARRLEPVEVEVEDSEGHHVVGLWDGRARRGEVVLETPASRRHVRIDPRHRIDQSAEVAGGHPLADDGDHLPLRPPLLRNFVISAQASEGVLVGLIDFAVRRRYDLEHSLGISASSDARAYGGGLRYGQGVGPKRDNNGRVGGLSVGLAVARLRPGFGVDGEGGVRGSLRVGAGLDTHRYFLDTRRGSSLSGSLSFGLTRSDSDAKSGTVGFALRGGHNVPLGLRGTLLLAGGVSGVFGRPLPSERAGLGGPRALRGYESDEVLGALRAFAVAEIRGVVLSDLALDLLHLVWLRQVELVAFAGGGFVVDAEDGRDLVPGAELGAGLRLFFDYGGVQPGLMGLDLAAPLLRTAADRAARPPVSVSLVFQQYF